MPKHCTVACDTPEGVLLCELELPDEATVGAALLAARARLGEAVADWQQAAVGIFGELCSREHVPAAGDRIELYRALEIDPRANRRARAAQTAGKGSRGRSGGSVR